ncbi:MAG: hypothetical protein RMJ98_02630 [Myxococcales bacterium]|nr:hypothetical protein [Myxococcales bacterium]
MVRIEDLGDLSCKAQPPKPGKGQNGSVYLTLPHLTEPGIHVTPQGDVEKVRTDTAEQGGAAEAGGTDASTRG